MKKSFHKSLHSLILTVFLLLTFIFSGYAINTWLRQTKLSNASDGEKRITWIRSSFDEKLNRARSALNKLQTNFEILFFLADTIKSGEWTEELQSKYYNQFIPTIRDSFLYVDETLVNISFWLTDEVKTKIPEYGTLVLYDTRISNVEWYTEFRDGTENFLFVPAHDYNLYGGEFANNKKVVSIASKTVVNEECVGIFIVDIGLDELLAFFDNGFTQDGVAFYSLAGEWIDGKKFEMPSIEKWDGVSYGNYYYNSSKVHHLDFEIVVRGKIDSIFQEFVGLAGILFIVLPLIIVASKMIHKKIDSFYREMCDVEQAIAESVESNFTKCVNEKLPTWKETAEIAEISNNLIEKIRGLLNAQVETAIEAKEAQLQALRYQINPHFIYNMLEAFRVRAYRCDKELARMIARFGRILRESISEDKQFITIEEELIFLEKYAEIYNFRFGDAFLFQTECDPALKDKRILRFILQPIVENAFVHGYVPQDGGKMEIKVTAKEEGGYLQLCVWDNGGGISEDRIKQIKENKYKSGSLGISNIKKRIALYYGEGSELRIESDGKTYTEVVLHLFLKDH